MGGFRKGGFSNNRFVLKPDVAIASEVSILSKNSLAITDFHAKKTQHVQLFENPPSWNPPIRDFQTDIFGDPVQVREFRFPDGIKNIWRRECAFAKETVWLTKVHGHKGRGSGMRSKHCREV